MTASNYQSPETIEQALLNPRYQGKIVVESPEGLFSTTKGENALKKLKQLEKKYSSDQIITTIIPQDTMIPMPLKNK